MQKSWKMKKIGVLKREWNLLQNGILNFAISLSQSPVFIQYVKVGIYTGEKATFLKKGGLTLKGL